MVGSGDEIYNPVTRTRVVFVTAPADNDGRVIAVDWYVPPGEALPLMPHYHAGPAGEVAESFDVIAGTAACTVGKRRIVVTAPATIEVRFNEHHVHPRNVGQDELHVRQRAEPREPMPETLQRLQLFFETFMALSQKGKVNRRGDITDPLQSAVTFDAYLLDPTYLPVVPPAMQKVLFGGMAWLGRRLGYEAYHAPEVGRQAPEQRASGA